MTGLPLNKDLTTRGGTLFKQTTTSPHYQLFAVSSTHPLKPGLRRVADGEDGLKIDLEIWSLPAINLADFMETIPSPLAIGSVEMSDGSWVKGFVCEPVGLEGTTDISLYGSWRSYLESIRCDGGKATEASPTIRTVLVASQGEIAVRIIRTLRSMNLRAVAIYSKHDAASPHVHDADIALPLVGETVADTYLNAEQILELACKSNADAIIPGYGFLSEDANFAKAVEGAGLIWVGPTPQQMLDLGLKHCARAIAEAASVPTVPGSLKLVVSIEDATAEAKLISYPLMLKSTAGGGGIGLRVCDDAESLEESLHSVQRLADANFGNKGVFLERFIQNARHVEVQVLGDGTGRVLAVGDRDCSLQRRYQKVVEEAPASQIPQEIRAKMRAAAMRLASSVQYRNIGTIEFIYDIDAREFYFLVVNTRLQVEHPVTEAVSGLDLVKCMLDIATGQCDYLFASLANDVPASGVSIEVQVYAENPLQEFQPCVGKISGFQIPPNVRVDAWIEIGTAVTASYDPMLAKVIAAGQTRQEALHNLAIGLDNLVLEGIPTNLEYLKQIVSSTMFQSGNFTTKSLDTFQIISPAFKVIEPGGSSTIQDYPGRVGLWSIGVPPVGEPHCW